MGKTLLMLSIFATLATPFPVNGQTSTAESQVRDVVRALFAAVERGDTAALDSLYSQDVTVMEGAGMDRGWAAYRDHHLLPELKQFRNFQYRPSDIESHASGDHAWAIFRYSIRAQVGERSVDSVGRGTVILERRNGRWVVVHTHTASRPRRPTDPA